MNNSQTDHFIKELVDMEMATHHIVAHNVEVRAFAGLLTSQKQISHDRAELIVRARAMVNHLNVKK